MRDITWRRTEQWKVEFSRLLLLFPSEGKGSRYIVLCSTPALSTWLCRTPLYILTHTLILNTNTYIQTMSFFRRKKDNGPLIPPVNETQARPDPYANSGAARNYSNSGGDPYASAQPARGGGDPYASSQGGADPYARASGGNPYERDAPNPADAARNELFAGFTAPDKPKAERKYGYEGREQEQDFDEEEEIEGIKQEMRGVKQDSLASTRWVHQQTELTSETLYVSRERPKRLLVAR
jgi:hypothetical protein